MSPNDSCRQCLGLNIKLIIHCRCVGSYFNQTSDINEHFVYMYQNLFLFYRFDDLVESIESVLLPLLTQIPSPDLYNLAPPSFPSSSHTPHSTIQDHTARLAKATMDAIENCKEEVPGYLEANQIALDGSVRESLAKVMDTCSQLASSDNYLEHKKNKVHMYAYRTWHMHSSGNVVPTYSLPFHQQKA